MNWVRLWSVLGVMFAVVAFAALAQMFPPRSSADAAAWTQAVLSAAAILVSGGLAVWVSHREAAQRAQEKREAAEAAHDGALMMLSSATGSLISGIKGAIKHLDAGTFTERTKHSSESFIGQALNTLNAVKIGDLRDFESRDGLIHLTMHATGMRAFFKDWEGRESQEMLHRLTSILDQVEARAKPILDQDYPAS